MCVLCGVNGPHHPKYRIVGARVLRDVCQDTFVVIKGCVRIFNNNRSHKSDKIT